jgi:hypothetical protein
MLYASDNAVPSYVPLAKRSRWRELWNLVYQQNIEKGEDEDAAVCNL